jgi:HPt (histidine-containing phosphotransfer) domain-containing protein
MSATATRAPATSRRRQQADVQNYINYFTEIEEHFQRRRGSLLLLSTLDWALVDSWREAGVPLPAVLRGIDAAFDKYEQRQTKAGQSRGRLRKVNGLAWCAQAVMEAVEAMHEAAVGGAPVQTGEAAGLERDRVAQHLRAAAATFTQAATQLPALSEIAQRLEQLATQPLSNEDLEQHLSALEEKLFAILLTHTPAEAVEQMREQATRELAPYRSRMQVLQIRQIEQQFLRRRLLERYDLPRISLFYMQQAD